MLNSTAPMASPPPARRSRWCWILGQHRAQHRLAQAAGIQDADALVGGGGLHQLPGRIRPGPVEGGVGGQDLRPAIRRAGMGVHHAAGQFDEFADVAHQQHLPEPVFHAQVDGVAHEIGAFDQGPLPGLGVLPRRNSSP